MIRIKVLFGALDLLPGWSKLGFPIGWGQVRRPNRVACSSHTVAALYEFSILNSRFGESISRRGNGSQETHQEEDFLSRRVAINS